MRQLIFLLLCSILTNSVFSLSTFFICSNAVNKSSCDLDNFKNLMNMAYTGFSGNSIQIKVLDPQKIDAFDAPVGGLKLTNIIRSNHSQDLRFKNFVRQRNNVTKTFQWTSGWIAPKTYSVANYTYDWNLLFFKSTVKGVTKATFENTNINIIISGAVNSTGFVKIDNVSMSGKVEGNIEVIIDNFFGGFSLLEFPFYAILNLLKRVWAQEMVDSTFKIMEKELLTSFNAIFDSSNETAFFRVFP